MSVTGINNSIVNRAVIDIIPGMQRANSNRVASVNVFGQNRNYNTFNEQDLEKVQEILNSEENNTSIESAEKELEEAEKKAENKKREVHLAEAKLELLTGESASDRSTFLNIKHKFNRNKMKIAEAKQKTNKHPIDLNFLSLEKLTSESASLKKDYDSFRLQLEESNQKIEQANEELQRKILEEYYAVKDQKIKIIQELSEYLGHCGEMKTDIQQAL